jgi:hypothetical protein
MGSLAYMTLTMDGYRGDLYPSKFTFATLPKRYTVVDNSDIGWEPEPMIVSLPKYVSPCNGTADFDRASLSPKQYELELFIARTNCSEEGGSSISECTSEASSWPARNGAEPIIQISHGAYQGQPTTTSSTLSSNDNCSKSTTLALRKVSSRKTQSLETEMEAGFASKLSDAPASKMCAVSIIKGHHSTKRKTMHIKQPVKLKQEQKRRSCLEKNRIAAASCRLKRQRRESELQTRSHELASNNSALKELVSGMQEELQQLKSMLSGHLSNECRQMSIELGEEFTEGAIDDCFQQMESCSEDSYGTMASFHPGSYNVEFCDDHDMFLDDSDLQAFSPLESCLSA